MAPKTVEQYINSVPEKYQGMLRELRKTIKEASPKLEEKISYSIPYYHYKGRVAYFRLAKKHLGFFIMTPVVDMFKKDLKNYSTTSATIRFPLDKKLPLALIKKMVKVKVKLNDELDK